MKSVGLPRKLLLKLVASVVCAFAITVAITWTVHAYLADRDAMKVINRGLDDVQGEIERCVNRKLVLAAAEVRDRLTRNPVLDADALRVLAVELRLDEIRIVDRKGIVVASAKPDDKGFDFHAGDAQTKEFLCLLDRETEFCPSFIGRSDDSSARKYVGIWRPEGGFVQVGCRASTLRVFARSAVVGLTRNRHIAGTGTIVVTTEQGHILSSENKSGLEGSVLQMPGDESYVVKRTIEGFDVYAILPKATAAIERNTLVGSSAVMTMLALGFVAILVGIVISRFVKEQVTKRIEAEMAMAKSIQANVMPSRFPPYPNLTDKIDLFARMITAKEVGGDFYDFYFVKSNKLAIVIADVSGKGVPAALFMMRAKATLQGHLKGGLDIVEAVVKTNDQLARDNDANMFVTAWIGIVDLATGEVEYVNAGHNPPLVRRADGAVDYLTEKSGPPLAAMDGVTYRRRTLALAPGDGILLYTDGVTEATNPGLTLYGEDRLKRAVGSLGTQGSTALIDGILEDVDAFADGAEQADDITMLGFRLVART